jgi:hypothetical protein
MTITIAGKSVHTGGIIAAVGGLVAVIGAFLTWYTMSMIESGMGQSITETADAKGIDSSAGILALILGIAAIALVAAWVMKVRIPMLSAIVVVVGVLILVVLALSLYTTILPMHFTLGGGVSESDVTGRSVMDAFNEFNKALDVAKQQATGMPGMTVSGSAGMSIGFILEAIAGVLVVIGGGLGLVKKS